MDTNCEKIFELANIQQIREFLLIGTECIEIDPKSYTERINTALKNVQDFFRDKYPDVNEYENIMEAVFDYASIYEDVFMEIGLQCGFNLAVQILKQ